MPQLWVNSGTGGLIAVDLVFGGGDLNALRSTRLSDNPKMCARPLIAGTERFNFAAIKWADAFGGGPFVARIGQQLFLPARDPLPPSVFAGAIPNVSIGSRINAIRRHQS